jgi:hypothetical protein
MPKARPAIERFWEKVKKTDSCWLWTASASSGKSTRNFKNNYGHFRVGSKLVAAHRFSWELHNGPIPEDKCVLHKCDNPPCVNPSHLFLGTKKDNSLDMLMKKRLPVGEYHHKAKLLNRDILFIKKEVNSGVKQVSLAHEFNVNRSTINNVVKGRRRKTFK